MGVRDLVDKIISDAEAESHAIIEEAEKTAAQIIAEANCRAERELQKTRESAEVKAKGIADTKAASARLDGGKILLSEKRGVIDDVYSAAAGQIAAMDKKDYLAFLKKLLVNYSETGDEVVLADNFPYASDIAGFEVVKQRKLKLVLGGAKISGGLILRGKNSDRDFSVEALIAADRARYEAEVAAQLLK